MEARKEERHSEKDKQVSYKSSIYSNIVKDRKIKPFSTTFFNLVLKNQKRTIIQEIKCRIWISVYVMKIKRKLIFSFVIPQHFLWFYAFSPVTTYRSSSQQSRKPSQLKYAEIYAGRSLQSLLRNSQIGIKKQRKLCPSLLQHLS